LIDNRAAQEFALLTYLEGQYMDNLSNNNHLNNTPPTPVDDLDKPIPLGDPPSADSPGVSRAPLNLGGGQTGAAPKPVPQIATPKPAPKIAPPVARKPAAPVAATATGARGRITGMKTFFTKLHPGALQFLDEQISNWLEKNPQVDIKHTNITTGEVQAKKTEPNIIITVWY
jgi:hypothetical protein